MNDLDQLLIVFDAYVSATGLAEATVSSRILGRGARIADLRAGGDMGSRTVHKAIEKFAENWPALTPWPEGVVRPDVPSNPQAAE
jgi:hypothetical protein